jgi:SAM-dependent methyltransferase
MDPRPAPSRSPAPEPPELAELMDRPDLGWDENRRALRDLDRISWWLLGAGAVVRTLRARLRAGRRRAAILDVGTGSGWTVARLARAARRDGLEVRVVGLDRKLAHLLAGRSRGIRQLRVVGDAQALPLRAAAVDWSLSSLFFHHFDAAGNRLVLAEMRRVARAGAAIVDLRRSPWSSLLVRLLLPLLGASRVTRHDGRLSVDGAWRCDEVARLVAGEPVLELRRRFPFRFSLVVAGGPAAPATADRA